MAKMEIYMNDVYGYTNYLADTIDVSKIWQNLATTVTNSAEATAAKKIKRSDTRLFAKSGKYYANIGNTDFCVMPKITNVTIINDCVVQVDFSDGTFEKSVLDANDSFNLDMGITVCVAKKLIGQKLCDSSYGSSIFNKIIKDGLKVYDDKLKSEQEAADRELIIQRKRERYAAKKARKKAKREAAEREKQIEIQAEAYYRAMQKLNFNDEIHG